MAGYSRLASLMGKHHDLAIFRQFSELNATNLLYMQGELVHLEAELKSLAVENASVRDLEKNDFEYSITTLMGPHKSKDGHEHWAKILEVRKKIKDYNEALCRFRKVCTFEQASKPDLTILQDWLSSREGGNCFLRGYEADTWDPSNEEDLISMTNKCRERDVLSKWIDVSVIPLYHRVLGHRLKDSEKLGDEETGEVTTPLYYYRDGTTQMVTDILVTILASMLPSLSAFMLFFIHSPIAKLGAFVALTVAFSITLLVMSSATRGERFAATATFAAVLVVFIGNFGPASVTT